MKFYFKLFFAFFSGLILITSCSKEETTLEALVDNSAQEEFANLEQELITIDDWEDLQDEIENGRLIINDPDYLALPDCATRTWEIIDGHSRKLTIDFGTEPCLGEDSLYRSGKIVIVFVGPRFTLGSSKSTTFYNYKVMNVEMNGTKTIHFLGNLTYSRVVDITKSIDSLTSTHLADQLVEKIAGYLTPERIDDIYKVIGSGSGVRANGMTYTSEIIDPLLRKMQPDCYRNFVDGEVLFINADGVETILDYDPIGGAPCDNIASITRNGHTHLITLW